MSKIENLLAFLWHFYFSVDLTTNHPNYRNCICMYLKVADVDRRHVVYAHCTASVIHFKIANELQREKENEIPRHFCTYTNAYYMDIPNKT